jgi:protein SCO1
MNSPRCFLRLATLARRSFSLVAAIVGLATGCTSHRPHTTIPASAHRATEELRTFDARGVVREIKPDRTGLVIRHEAIPGYMAAMTMPFEVREPRELDGVNVGNRVAFRLQVTETDGWIDRVVVLAAGEPEEADELKEGDLMPDYAFIDEQRRPVRLSQFRGQALGFTFIYTRCPYPTFCPRQSANFAAACQQLTAATGGPSNWHLLSISFEPAHDTPAVLREYASRYDHDPKRWSFLTGKMIDIDAITEQFGMFYARDDAGFSHNVRTVVVDAAGRIRRILIGNAWTVDDFVTAMTQAAQAVP